MGPRLKLFLPLFIFTALALFLFRGLSLNPNDMPSALIDKPLPTFSLPDLEGKRLLTRADVVGEVTLLNVWASWCISCRVEHPFLQSLADGGVRIVGVNYKEEADGDGLRWLAELGDPYAFNIDDRQGSLGLDLGVYGAPETYLLDREGVIKYRHAGVVDGNVWQNVLSPLYDELQGRAP